ncbi:MAG: DUF4349 domain-containing protein [Lachnospiraceae bacterium]|nr:DUF4349 domain-containing protein [Lachnospiraceae bacterium]
MKRKLAGIVTVLVLSMVSLTGCGSNKNAETTEMVESGGGQDSLAYDESFQSAAVPEGNALEDGATAKQGKNETGIDKSIEKQNGMDNRKLIKNVSMNVETEDYDTLLVSIYQRINELNGYVQTSDMGKNATGYEEQSRYANITARIPKDKIDGFVTEISEKANVIYKNENVEDVTLNYVDVESHKKVLETQEKRLLELLEKAESMEDIIALETKLSEVRYQIESYTSQIRTYDNQIEYSTVNLYIQEVATLTPQIEPGVGEQIKTGFLKNVSNILESLKSFGIWIVISIPYFIIIAILVVIAYIIYRKINEVSQKRYKKHVEQKALEQEKKNESQS